MKLKMEISKVTAILISKNRKKFRTLVGDA